MRRLKKLPRLLFVFGAAMAVAATDAGAGPAECVEAKAEKKASRKAVESECKPVERDPAVVKAEAEALRAAAFERARNALAAEFAQDVAKTAKTPGANQKAIGAGLPQNGPSSAPGCIAGCYGRP